MTKGGTVIERNVIRNGITLAGIAALCTAMVAITYQLTKDRVEDNRRAWLERSLQPALAGLFFDSGVTESKISIPAPHALPGREAAIVYRIYAEDQPVAALFVVSARDGYAGPIRLLVGIRTDGSLTGVRVLEHRETPGLGDRVEIEKSDWVLQFEGRSVGNPSAEQWAIKGDGGDFDQLTGASVTPRAIVKAVRQTLDYFASNQDAIFAAESMPEDAE